MKKITILALSLFSTYTFSQNLVVGKRGYSEESESTIYSLLTLNSNTGEILSTIDYETDFSDGYLPICLSFNSQTNEIVGISPLTDAKIVSINTVTNSETVLTIPEFYYQGAIVADNRLFLTNTDTIDEINPLNGDVIATHTLTTADVCCYNRNLTYSSTTKDIYGIVGNMIFKFNIITNQETAFVLPNESFYLDAVIAENRLFVNTQENTLLEIDTENGSIINTYTFTTNLEYYDIRYMTFLADTQEICMIARGYSETGHIAKIVKYNINTNSESSFDLPEVSGDYGKYIVSTITEENLSFPEFQKENDAKVIKAYNLLGQEVSVETYNQIIILKYDNGETKKVYIKK